MYSDEIKKIEYYKNKIINDFIKNGKVINDNELQKKIDQIDTKLSIFSQGFIENGEKLNLKKFNEQKIDIWEDLKILYEIIYELSLKRVTDLELLVNYNINYLDEINKKYVNKSKIETLAINGKTIYFATNGFDQTYNAGKVEINLGPLTVTSGSYLIGLFNSKEIDKEKVLFYFDDNIIRDYSYSKDYLKLNNNYITNNYEYNTEEKHTTNFEIKLDIELKDNNKYYIYPGLDHLKIYHYETGETEYVLKKYGVPYQAKDKCDISFYIYDSTNINFDINNLYDSKNFNNNIINSPKKRQFIKIKCNPGFILDYDTDGKTYSDRGNCYVKNNTLISSQSFGDLNDYMIEEISFGEDISFSNVRVILNNVDSSFYDIDSIAIKELQNTDFDEELNNDNI